MILATLACPVFTSCYDETALSNRVDELEQGLGSLEDRVTALENRLNDELSALKSLIESQIKTVTDQVGAVAEKVDGLVTVSKCEANEDGTYEITLSDGSKFTVYPEYEQDLTGIVTTIKIGDEIYWAIYGEDGKAEVVTDSEGAPVPVVAATPQVDVNEMTGDVYITFDNGENWINIGNKKPCVFADAEVVYTDNYTDEEEAKYPNSCYEEPMYVVITLADGSTITVTIDGAASFMFGGHSGLISGTQYICAGTTKNISFLTTNIQDWIKEVPAGWQVVEKDVQYAEYGGASFVVTAPTLEAVASGAAVAEGTIKILAVAQGGKSVTAALKVTIEAFETVSAGKNAVTVKMNNGIYGYILGVSPVADYNAESIVSTLKPVVEEMIESMWGSYPAWDAWYALENDITLDDNTFDYSIADYSFDELNYVPEMEYGQDYIVWAVAVEEWYSAGGDFGYSLGNITSVPYHHSVVVIETQKCTFNDIQIKAEFKGIDAYYGGFYKKYSNNETLAEDLLSEFNSSFNSMYGGYQLMYVNDEYVEGWENAIYTGSPIALVNGYEQLTPGTDYYFFLIPAEDGKEKYSMSDMYFIEWSTAALTAGGQTPVVAADATIEYQKISVPLSAEEAVYIYYKYVEPSKLPTIQDKAAYLLENGYLAKGGAVTANQTGLKPGTPMVLLAMAVDQNGCYGDVYEKEYSSKEMEYASAVVVAELQGDASTSAVFKVSCDAEVDTYIYWCGDMSSYSWNSQLGGSLEAATSFIPLNPDHYLLKKVASANLPEAGIEVTGLKVNTTCAFVVSAKLKDGSFTKATMVTFTPMMSLGNFVYATDENGNENPVWVAAKPTVTANVDMVADFADVTWTVSVPAGYTAKTAVIHEDNFTDYPSAKSKVQYILTDEYVTLHEVVEGETYAYPWGSKGCNIYTVVCDADGNYYEVYVTKLDITGGFGV